MLGNKHIRLSVKQNEYQCLHLVIYIRVNSPLCVLCSGDSTVSEPLLGVRQEGFCVKL